MEEFSFAGEINITIIIITIASITARPMVDLTNLPKDDDDDKTFAPPAIIFLISIGIFYIKASTYLLSQNILQK